MSELTLEDRELTVKDRARELKAFDDTKSGVKGLVDSGISSLPQIFIHSAKEPSSISNITIPTIDIGGLITSSTSNETRSEIIKQVKEASRKWGFFQVINHGIPISNLESALDSVRNFHEQKDEVKKQFYTRDFSKKFVYNSNYDIHTRESGGADWRDTFFCRVAPDPPKSEELPEVCKYVLTDYSEEVKKLGGFLFELISEALGLKPEHLKEMNCAEGMVVICHYYPACPDPDKAIGTSKHTDSDFLTVLLQDHIGGLQVLHEGQWVDVPPIPGALVVNIGDLLQLISNDELKSVEHRVLTNRIGPRISVACFFSTSVGDTSRKYGTIKELVSEDSPAMYRDVTVREFVTYSLNKGLDGTSPLLYFKTDR